MRTADGIIIFCYNTTEDKDNSQRGPFLVVTNSPLTYNCDWIIKAYPYLFCCSCKNLSRSYALLKVRKSDQTKSHSLWRLLFCPLARAHFHKEVWKCCLTGRSYSDHMQDHIQDFLLKMWFKKWKAFFCSIHVHSICALDIVLAVLKSPNFIHLQVCLFPCEEQQLYESRGRGITVTLLCLFSPQRFLSTLTCLSKMRLSAC